MRIIYWENKTELHPNGVCEAAVSMWLRSIPLGSMETANELRSTDCDVLQALCESDQYTWAVDLQAYIGGEAVATFSGVESGVRITTAKELLGLMQTMKDRDFFYVSATSTNGFPGGHAIGLVYIEQQWYAFDPNFAIYSVADAAELQALADKIMQNLAPWDTINLFPGKFLVH